MDASTPMSAEEQRKQDRKRKRKALLAGGVVLGLGAAATLAAWSDDVFANGTFNTGGFELQGKTTGGYENFDGPDVTPPTGESESATLSFDLEALEMTPSQTVYAPISIATSPETNLDGSFFISNVSATGKYAPILTYRVYEEATHGANCTAANSNNLTDQWTNPTSAVGDFVDDIVNYSPDGTATPFSGLGAIVDPLLAVINPSTDPLGALPVFGPAPATAAAPKTVAANQGSEVHLCIAVTLGIPTSPLLPGVDNPLGLINNAAVTMADLQGDDDTVVTWEFTGYSEEPA